MNSFFSNLNSGFLNSLQAAGPQNTMKTPNLLFQALGAAMRGESPQTFMQNLARQHPLLRQYDLTNLENTAQQVCQQNGVNMQEMVNTIDNLASPLIRK